MQTLHTKQELQVGFYEKPDTETWIKNAESLKPWEKRPFFNDGWIFNPSHNDPTEAVDRFYDNTESGIRGRDYRRLYRNMAAIFATYKNMALFAAVRPWFKNSSLNNQKPDQYWDWKLDQEYDRVKAEQFPIELSQQEKASVRVGSSQSNRQIWEDCQWAGGQVRIPQLVRSGDHSVPSHLDITKITRYMKISYADAYELARIYQVLNLDFKSLVTYHTKKRVTMAGVPAARSDKTASRVGLSVFIGRFVKRTGDKPWNIPVAISPLGQKLTLKDLADEMEMLANQDQEAPDWMIQEDPMFQQDQHGNSVFNVMDDAAAGCADVLYGSSRTLNDSGFYELEDERELSHIPNPVGHQGGFTYWQDSTIPTPNHLLNAKTNKLFKRIEAAILNHHVKLENLPKLNKYIARLTPSQKARIRQAKRVAFNPVNEIDYAVELYA